MKSTRLLALTLAMLLLLGRAGAQSSDASFRSIGVRSHRVQFTTPVPDAPLLIEAPRNGVTALFLWSPQSGLQHLPTPARNLGQVNSTGTLVLPSDHRVVFSLDSFSELPLPWPQVPAGHTFYTFELAGFLGANQTCGLYTTTEPLPNGWKRFHERLFIFDFDSQSYQVLPVNNDNGSLPWQWTAVNRSGTLGLLMRRASSNPGSSLRLWRPEGIGPVFTLDVNPVNFHGAYSSFKLGLAPSASWAFFQANTPNQFEVSSSFNRFSRFSFAGATQDAVVPTSPLAPGLSGTSVLGITDDGTAFGSVRPLNSQPFAACLWLPNGARVDLKRELESRFGLNLAGWQLQSVDDASPDGLMLCGHGINPSGLPDTWIAALPAPLPGRPPLPRVTLRHGIFADGESHSSVTVPSFASVSAGDSLTRVCHIINQGAAPLEISAFSWSGENAADFSIPDLDLPLILPPGTSRPLPITFSPRLTGLKSASLHLSTNDPETPESVFLLSGLGPVPKLSDSGQYRITSALVGTSHLRWIRVTNSGTGDLSGLSLALTGDPAFSIPAHLLTEIPVNAHVDIPVLFSPVRSGTAFAQLQVFGSHSSDPALTVNWSCSARSPNPFTLADPSGVMLPAQDPAFDLGSVTVGAGFSQPFVLSSTAPLSNPLRFQVAIEGPDAADFSVGLPPPLVESQATGGLPKTLTVLFSPSTPGPKLAWLVIGDVPSSTVETQQFASPHRLRLSAQALPPSAPSFAFHSPAPSSLNGSTSVRFRVIGSPPVRFRILEDNIPGPWQTAQVETSISITPSDFSRGRMRLELNNDQGSALGPEFHVGLFSPQLPATLSLLQGSPLHLECSASGPDLQFQWLRGGTPLPEDGPYQGTRTRLLHLPNIQPENEGSYSCRVTLNSPTGPVTRETSLSAVRVTTSLQVMPFSLRPVRAQEAVAFYFAATNAAHRRQLVEAGRFSVQGLPPGLRFDSLSGFVFGMISRSAAQSETRIYTVTVRAKNAGGWSPPFVAHWPVEPYDPSSAGTYLGVLDRFHSDALSSSLAGRVSCTITASGRYTGRVSAGGVTRSIAGPVFSASPGPASAAYSPPLPEGLGERTDAPTAYIPWFPVPGLGYTDLALSFEGSLMGGVLVGEYEDGYISGARRAAASPVSPSSGGPSSTYHLQFSVPSSAPDTPQGHGYLASTFAPSGAVTFKGRLPDGAPFTGSTAAVQFGDAGPWAVPLHQTLYSRLGSAYGWIFNHPSQPGLIAAELDWLKNPASEKSPVRAYREGFHIQTLNGEGSLFTPPPAGSLFHDFTPSQSPATASLLLSGGFLSQPSITVLQFSSSGALSLVPLPAPVLPSSSFQLKLNPRSGLLSGSGKILDNNLPARPAQFGALWIPHRQSLAGYFTLPESSSSKSPMRAGLLDLTPLPAPASASPP